MLAPLKLIFILTSIGSFQQASDAVKEFANFEATPDFPPLFRPPALPSIFSSLTDDSREVTIISETIDGRGAYVTSEEYIDLDARRGALVLSQKDGEDGDRKFVFSDANLNGLYIYKPYTCKRFDSASEEFHNELDLWYSTKVEALEKRQNGEPKYMLVFNVAALWLFAEEQRKYYELQSESVHGNTTELVHRWLFDDSKHNRKFQFEFLEVQDFMGPRATLSPPDISLNAIKIFEHNFTIPVHTINVLSVQYSLDSQVYANLLQLPLGFGCISDAENWKKLQQDLVGENEADLDEFWASFSVRNARVELDINSFNAQAGEYDSALVELARAQMTGSKDLTMTRIKRSYSSKNSSADIKTVSNYYFNVRYTIDLLKSKCEMSHIKSSQVVDNDENLIVKFSNKLQLSLHESSLKLLFEDNKEFNLVKYVELMSGRKKNGYFYLERSIENWPPFGNKTIDKIPKFARIVRTYLAVEQMSEVQYGKIGRSLGEIELLNVKVLVFDRKTRSKLFELYRIDVVNKERPLKEGLDGWKVFDVSQQCYLDAPNMLQGRDYAWARLTYAMDNRHLQALANNKELLKSLLYWQFIKPTLSAFRVPRAEFLFSDEGFQIRMLILNVPPLDLVFELLDGVSIHVSGDNDSTELAPDLQHCGRKCQSQWCKSFTFCQGTHVCLLGSNVAIPMFANNQTPPEKMQKVNNNSYCQTYSASPKFADDFSSVTSNELSIKSYAQPLHRLVAWLQHQDYEISSLVPRPSDEIRLPRDETGLTEIQYQNEMKRYEDELEKFLVESNIGALSRMRFRLSLNSGLVVALPSKFALENDPLEELEANSDELRPQLEAENQPDIDEDDDDGIQVHASAFHEGLSMTRFKLNSFLNQQSKNVDVHAQLFPYFTYDQCASACMDSKCGSFSYCTHRKECIVTSLKTVSEAKGRDLLENDVDCFFSQRNFLRNFERFPGVNQPKDSVKQSKLSVLLEPSDCALQCVSEEEFECLSFQFCNIGNQRLCLYQANRLSTLISSTKWAEDSPEGTICDHYKRSTLADFIQLEHRQITKEALIGKRTTLYAGQSVEHCARLCGDPLNECRAFQHCTSNELVSGEVASLKRECMLIQDKLTNNLEATRGLEIVVNSKGEVGDVRSLLSFSANCNVFAWRQLSSQNHLQALGNVMTVNEKHQFDAQLMQRVTSSHISLGKCLLLFILLVGLSGTLAFGARYALEHNEMIRQQADRLWLALFGTVITLGGQ